MGDLISKKEAAKRLDISQRMLDKLRTAKRIKSLRIGTRVKFRQEDIENYVKKQIARV